MDKTTLRQKLRRMREALSPEQVAMASQGVHQQLAAWPPLTQARTVLAYLPFRNEIDLRPLFDQLAHISWILPRVEGKRLFLHPYVPGRLTLHRYGMWEPAADLPVVAPEKIDLVLVPGIAFDRRGYRLGFGGGYYDRFLPTCPALRAGIAYEFSLLDELPVQEHDQRVQWVITPGEIVNCSTDRSENGVRARFEPC